MCSNLKSKNKNLIYSVNFGRSINITGRMIIILGLNFVQDWSGTYYSDLQALVVTNISFLLVHTIFHIDKL